jgi:signal transduction histidine kinase
MPVSPTQPTHNIALSSLPLLLAMADTLTVGLLLVDPELRLLYLNPLAREYLGLPAAEPLFGLALSALASVLAPALALALLEHYQAVWASLQVASTILPPGGAGKQHMRLSLTPLFDADGELAAISGQLEGITEAQPEPQHQHQPITPENPATLPYSQRYFDQVFGQGPMNAWIKNANGQYLYINRPLEDFLGLGQQAVLGQSDWQLFPALAEGFVAQDQEVLRAGLPLSGLVFAKDSAGHEYPWLGVIFPYETLEGLGTAGFSVNAVELQHLQEQRLQTERQMLMVQKLESIGVLVDGLAHDFNNSLMAVLGFASLAQEELQDDPESSGYLDEIIAASRQMSNLCRQMIIYAGKSDVKIHRLSLNAVIDQMAPLLLLTASANVELRHDLASNLPLIEADPNQMRQVIMSLVTNAVEAITGAISQHNGVVSLRTTVVAVEAGQLRGVASEALAAGDYCLLEVSDSGVGMSPEVQAKMFDPFFSSKFIGRGLGLAAVQGIVRVHRGAIEVRSQVGAGTTMRVFLPLLHTAG